VVREVFEGGMVSFRGKFGVQKAGDFGVVNGRIELFYIEDMRCDRLGIDMALLSQVPQPLIEKAEHACRGKPAGFRAHDGPLHARLPTAFGHGFRKQHNRLNHFVIMLNIVDKVEFVLGKVLRSRHTNPPSARVSRRITASPRASSSGSSGLYCRYVYATDEDSDILSYKK